MHAFGQIPTWDIRPSRIICPCSSFDCPCRSRGHLSLAVNHPWNTREPIVGLSKHLQKQGFSIYRQFPNSARVLEHIQVLIPRQSKEYPLRFVLESGSSHRAPSKLSKLQPSHACYGFSAQTYESFSLVRSIRYNYELYEGS